MAYNKIEANGETLIDLTSDTVTASTLLQGETAHDRSGAQITGKAVTPTVNDGTLTIQQNGTTKATFTANQAGNTTANIETGDAYGIDMYDATLPINITARGNNLEDWVIYGNDEGVGEYDAESEGYVLPIITKQKSKKNMLELLADTQTINGVTFTVDKLAGTITVNGTATANAFFGFNLNLNLSLPRDVELKLTGCPSGGGLTNYRIDLRNAVAGTVYNNAVDAGNGVTFIVTGDGCNVANIRIQNGYVCNNLVFRPMIRLSSESADFESYWTPNATTNIYLGTSPLTEGQSLSKSQATTKDIPTFNGECTIDTSYPNKPRMEIIPTDSAINIINGINEIKSDMRGVTQDLDDISEELDCLLIQAALVNNEVIIQNTSDFTIELYGKYFSYTKPKFAILELHITSSTYYYKALINSSSVSQATVMEASFITVNGTYMSIYKFNWSLSGTVGTPTVSHTSLNLGS